MEAHGEDLRAEIPDDEDAEALVTAIKTDYRTARLDPSDRLMLDFAVRLTRTPDRMSASDVEELRQGYTRYLPLGLVVASVVIVEIAHVIWFRSQDLPLFAAPVARPADYSNTKELGAVLYTEHVYAFEIAAVILLLAIVAAITLTMRRRPGLKVQNISKQVAVRREDRVRLVKVDPVMDDLVKDEDG